MESIKQKHDPPALHRTLPDFRNLGVLLRVLLLVNLCGVLTVLIQQHELAQLKGALLTFAGELELPLLVMILLLYLAQPMLARLPQRAWRGVLVVASTLVATVVYVALGGADPVEMWRRIGWAIGVTLIALAYLAHRSQSLSPALAEARLLALTSRIRPHFLFNALNGVLGVMRDDPRRAERALEELAELFRVLMRDNRELMPLADEIQLCERYLDLEQLRLGDRLQVRWNLEGCPRDALVPPLMLQPLLENAVYHGVEPARSPGEIVVEGRRRGTELILSVDNPLLEDEAQRHHVGNRMALDNIRERLMLFFDLDARLDKSARGGRYRVTIRLPYRRKKG